MSISILRSSYVNPLLSKGVPMFADGPEPFWSLYGAGAAQYQDLFRWGGGIVSWREIRALTQRSLGQTGFWCFIVDVIHSYSLILFSIQLQLHGHTFSAFWCNSGNFLPFLVAFVFWCGGQRPKEDRAREFQAFRSGRWDQQLGQSGENPLHPSTGLADLAVLAVWFWGFAIEKYREFMWNYR